MSDAQAGNNVQGGVAVRLPAGGAHCDKLEQYLASRAWSSAKRFLPKDDDELNDRLCRGEFGAVVFATPEDAMSMIWSGHGSISLWQVGGEPVAVHFAIGDSDNGAPWVQHLIRMERAFTAWETARRRRQVVAGTILTAIALLGMALLLFNKG